MSQKHTDEIRQHVRDSYAKVAEASDAGACCGETPSCCGVSDDAAINTLISTRLGYSAADLAAVPEGADMGLGCGNPRAIASLQPGEVVVDLGSGGGFDAFLAAPEVGATGRVIGVDMTPAMVAHARAAAERLGLGQVAFREGRIEALPLDDAAADVVISNCVVNLSVDVEAVLREALRVLRPGGRLRITDTFRRGPAVADPATDGWCACVDGAHDPDALAELARRVGFDEVAVVGDAGASGCGDTFSATLCATRPRGGAPGVR